MAPRLGHKKSRNGCIACKRRRVKCDEKKPCGACSRYGWQCSLTADGADQLHYEQTPSARPAAAKSPTYTSNTTGTPSSRDAIPGEHAASPIASNGSAVLAPADPVILSNFPYGTPLSPFSPRPEEQTSQANQWLQDLELLHHWCTSTYLTFQMPKHNHDLWQIAVPRVAFQHAFLMHGLLAVTSLHLAYLLPSERHRYSLISTSHQNIALAGFSSALQNVSRENADAVFLGSIFVSLFAFANSSMKSMDPDESYGMDDVVKLLALIRGIEQTLSTKNTRMWVQEGQVASMLRAPRRSDPAVKKSENLFRPYLDDLKDFIARSRVQYEVGVGESVTHALAELDRTYELMLTEKPVINSGYIMSWPTCVSMEFLLLIQEGNPLALILLAVFCALLHYHEDRWVWHLWGARVADLVLDALDSQWHKWLKWPKDVIDSGVKFKRHEDVLLMDPNPMRPEDNGWQGGSTALPPEPP